MFKKWFSFILLTGLTLSQAFSGIEQIEGIEDEAIVLSEETSERDNRGNYTQTKLVQTEIQKYPLLRLITVYQSVNGRERVVSKQAEVANQVYVALKANVSESILTEVLEKELPHNFRMTREELIYAYRIDLLNPTLRSVPNLIKTLSALPGVQYAESNPLVFSDCEVIPNDTSYSEQWHLERLKMPLAWSISVGKIGFPYPFPFQSEVKVAVIDTGIDYKHEDLKANTPFSFQIGQGQDFTEPDSDPMDEDGHGTSVAGVIGAVSDNQKGVAGVIWNVSLMPIKAQEGKYGDLFAFIKGIFYATANGAKIINISNGAVRSHYEAMRSALQYANVAGVLVVGSAGNDGIENKYSFANNSLPNVIIVANSDKNDSLADSSNYSASQVDLAAPGEYIFTTTLNNGYDWTGGTSLSAPQVSGVAALIKAMQSDYTPAQTKNLILSMVDKVPALEGKVKTGGRLNALKVVNFLSFEDAESCNIGEVYIVKHLILGDEKSGSVKIALERKKGTKGKLEVMLKKVSGTATQGLDYTLNAQLNTPIVTWKDGEEGTKFITIPILQDNIGEDNEYIDIEFSSPLAKFSPQNGEGGGNVINLFISDDEPVGKAEFKEGSYLVNESVGTVNVEVIRAYGASSLLAVEYTIVPTGTSSWEDINAESTGKLTWNPGETGVKVIPIKVINDLAKEGKEQFKITLSSFDPENIGYPNKTYLIIKKSDEANFN